MKILFVGALLWVGLSALSSPIFAQGPLTPPGAPAPTMKALDQVASTGVAINSTNTPPSGNYLYVIGTPGNYYLKGNVTVVGATGSGIHVTAAGVTIDLNGFQISGPSGSGDGIDIDAAAHRCTVKNGTILGFSFGVQCLNNNGRARGGSFLQLAVSACTTAALQAGDGWQIDGCQAHDDTGVGISGGGSNTITGCTATNNGGDGIDGGPCCTLTNCTATNNSGLVGIFSGEGSTLSNCTACVNKSQRTTSYGIYVGNGSTVTGCTARSNTNSNTPTANTGVGIYIGTGSTLSGSTATNNLGDGIQFVSWCLISGNNSISNGETGFRNVNGGGNRIDGNQAITNGLSGFYTISDVLIRNTSFANQFNYAGSGDTRYLGPIGGTPDTATSPWANF